MSGTTDTPINMASSRRPRSFSDIIGQPYAAGLGKQLGAGKISGQGYIISGPKGCGKTTLARIIAQSLNCKNRNPETGDPCQECSSCIQVNSGMHTQIREINAAAHRGINEVKDVLAPALLAVPEGYRVFIFDEAHMFTKDAFSVLLKPMEEPPKNVIYILATTNPEVIPETILSRSPIIPILPLSDEELRIVLHNTIEEGKSEDDSWGKITDADIDNAIRSAGGSARQAITNLSGVIFHGISDTSTSDSAPRIAQAMISGSVDRTLSLAGDALKDKTSDPSALITAVMDELLRLIDSSDRPDLVARMVAELSTVSSDASSSPAIIVSARIASCVQNPSTPPQNTPQTHQVARRDDENRQMTSNPSSDSQRLKTEMRASEDMINHGNLDDVVDTLLKSELSKKHLPKKWRQILDDPDSSEITVNKKGTVTISVPSPDKELDHALSLILINNFMITSLY